MNRNIIITGGSKGIGAAMVEMFAQENDNILFNYNKSEKEAIKLASKPNVEAIQADLSIMEDIDKFTKRAIEKFEKIDVLINNAGVDQFKLFTDITENDWNEIINTNLKSAVFISKEI